MTLEPPVVDLTVHPYTYVTRAFDRPAALRRALRAHLPADVDTFAVTGTSGLLVARLLAERPRRNVLVIRKPNDGSHSLDLYEGRLGNRWVMLDDFIQTGETLDRVWRAVRALVASHRVEDDVTFAGAYMYAGWCSTELCATRAVDRPDPRWLTPHQGCFYTPERLAERRWLRSSD